MYVPSSFAQTDAAEVATFVQAHSFATLVSMHDGEPFATHLPLLVENDGDDVVRLLGHVARANPQWKTADGQVVLAIFSGPHAYISPAWYQVKNAVPTWNYVSVHAYGILKLVESDERLLEIVRRTVQTYEAGRAAPWDMGSADAAFIEQLLKAIVGFEVEITRVEGKSKLSQNHDIPRRERVIDALKQQGEPDSIGIARLMQATLPAT